jgi:hypothetical protein
VLIKEDVEWASKEGNEPPIPTIVRQSVKEVAGSIHVARPQRQIPTVSINEDETGGQKQRREMLATAEKEAAKQTARETSAREQEEASEREVQRQSDNPPLNEADWNSHIAKYLLPVVRYIFTRFQEGGDRYEAVAFYRGARVFNPTFAKTISLVAANHRIEKLKHCPCLNKPEIIQALKSSFKVIKEAADKVISSGFDVLQWHLDLNTRLKKEIEEDARVQKCRHCKSNPVC